MSDTDVVGRPGRIFEERPGLSRRQLIAAGAWAAPILVLATAAPAHAAVSGEPAPPGPRATLNVYTFAQDNFDQTWSAARGANVIVGMKGHTAFTPAWDTASPITALTLTLVTSATGLLAETPVVTSGAGWSAVSGVRSGANMIYTFAFSGSVAANTTSPELRYTLPGDGVTRTQDALPKSMVGTFSGNQITTLDRTTSW